VPYSVTDGVEVIVNESLRVAVILLSAAYPGSMVPETVFDNDIVTSHVVPAAAGSTRMFPARTKSDPSSLK
jgi:hypothetical protein